MAVWHWFLQVTGTDNESGKWYAFWSGFGADFTEGAIFLSIIGLYRRHKCQSCWRPALKGGLGRVEGTHYERVTSTPPKSSTTRYENSIRRSTPRCTNT